MSNVAQRVFVLGNNNNTYMTLANEEFVRTLAIGSNWTRLRLGILVAFTPDGTNNIAGAVLALGMSAGVNNPFGAALTDNFYGGSMLGAATGQTMLYNAGGGNPYFTTGGVVNQIKRVGGVTSTGSSAGIPDVATNTGTTQRRTAMFLELIKGVSNSVASFTMSVAIAQTDCPFYAFLDAMETTSPVIAGNSYGNLQASSFEDISEAAGALDTFNVFWNKSAFPLEIYGMAVYRYQ